LSQNEGSRDKSRLSIADLLCLLDSDLTRRSVSSKS
jgi:hypothetical protein